MITEKLNLNDKKVNPFILLLIYLRKLMYVMIGVYKGIFFTMLIHIRGTKNKFSVVIPTIYKSEYLHKLIAALNESDAVLEILLIDNANKNGSDLKQYEKVKVLNQLKNIYVNPAWNLGVATAVSDYLLICNDDIFFDTRILKKMLIALDQQVGIIGINDTPSIFNFLRIKLEKVRLEKFGTMMFIHKQNYHPIPDELLIWCGDDYLFNSVNAMNFSISGFKYETKMSTSSGLDFFDKVKLNDRKVYNEKYRNNFKAYYLRG